ncbi:Txe/YoeB family addiction module toxin [Rhodocyclus purpureus]|uniref:Txe/YoeB family addiction module toxin n=1 Tax=Rhodocyclus purpureus TaxID=1067 RepID=UPI0019149174|nr:Txe/YoeB family addiction module toxin [Rhodocyclus purpureus]MBK5912745.1 Txe/YoeB family addiction module toxin [Rhodocyclus purpureus]
MSISGLSRITWTVAAWEDYQWWQGQDRKTLSRINSLIQDCLRDPFVGIGKPEPLKENLSGFWSRRIDDSHRLVYCVDAQDLVLIACRYHYA